MSKISSSIINLWLILLILPSLMMGAPATTDITSVTGEPDLISTINSAPESFVQKDSTTIESLIQSNPVQPTADEDEMSMVEHQAITTSIPESTIQLDHVPSDEDLMPETLFGMQVKRNESNEIGEDEGNPKLTTVAPAVFIVSETERTSESPSAGSTDAGPTTIIPPLSTPMDHTITVKADTVIPIVFKNPPLSIGDYLKDVILDEAVKEVMMDENKESIPTDEKVTTWASVLPEVSSIADLQTTVVPPVIVEEIMIHKETSISDHDLADVTEATLLGNASGFDPEKTKAAHQDPEETVLMDEASISVTDPSFYVTVDAGLSTNQCSNEIITAAPLELVSIYDPSEYPEATTFLAEANYEQTEPTDTIFGITAADNLDVIQVETEEPTTPLPEEDSKDYTTDSSASTADYQSPPRRQPRPSQENKRSYNGYKVYRVILPTEDSVRLILSMEDEPGVDFWADPRLLLRPRGLFVTSAADIMVAPQRALEIEQVLRDARLTFSVLLDDVQKAISKENPSGLSYARSHVTPSGTHRLTWDRYHRLSDIYSFLDYLREAHSDWIEVMPIGKSSQGRPIHVVKVSRNSATVTDAANNKTNEKKKKKAILIDAGVHGNEWITPAALTWMVNELVGSATDDYKCILERFDWYFIPMLNPDGYEYSHVTDRLWRKNRRNETHPMISSRKKRVDDGYEECVGVDLNSNFEFNWKKGNSINSCSPAYAGRKPFSEPESRALANFMLQLRPNLAMYISLHSYSQMWLLPWAFTKARPEDFSQLYSLAKVGARALQSVYNTSYLIGSVPDLLAISSGTSQDWAKGVAGVEYSYTLEMRDAGEKGLILPAQQIIPTAQETWTGIYAAAQELAHRLYPYSPSCLF